MKISLFSGLEDIEEFAENNNRIDMRDFQIPEKFDLETVITAITTVSSHFPQLTYFGLNTHLISVVF